MEQGRSVSASVLRIGREGTDVTVDELAVEEPLEIRLDGERVATTMRTPGHDDELAAGFCWAEDLLGGADILRVGRCAAVEARGGGATEAGAAALTANVVVVDTGCLAPAPTARLGTTTSSCGWCGTGQLDVLRDRFTPVRQPIVFDLDALAAIPDRVRPHQRLFDLTGGVHAAAAFDADGSVLVVREDIGRHNAVDKVVGRLLLGGALPAAGLGLFVSGRASFELVQKAWAAGFAALVAVSAPSSLAVDAARRANLLLAGFVRPGRVNVYAEPVAGLVPPSDPPAAVRVDGVTAASAR
ncbi:MAG TPA: formate dehydrogenase accessory sulfurtransferase FdhD [Acidimicrobiales bacterium]|jgi:FdhD protein|nr:formate dehydrogenase accessory sulfurtransferase FdhD [Acidimicrobiales bacterium]